MLRTIHQTELEEAEVIEATSPIVELGPEPAAAQFAESVRVARRESQRRRRRTRLAQMCGIGWCAGLAAAVVATGLLTGHYPTRLLAFTALTALLICAYGTSREHRNATLALSRADDVRAVGELVDTLDFFEDAPRNAAIDGLTRLLPRLEESDSRVLDARQRLALNRVLAWPNDNPRYPKLRVAIVQAYDRIGDAESLRIVRRLANGQGAATGDPILRRAAEECLPVLEALVERQSLGGGLLRAAEAPRPSASLLRPAGSTTYDTASTLVRPISH